MFVREIGPILFPLLLLCFGKIRGYNTILEFSVICCHSLELARRGG